MLEGQGTIIDFRDVLSISDPVVRGVLESCVLGGLARVSYRQFRLTSRIMVVLFDKGSARIVTDVLHKLQQKLDTSHCGHLAWKLYDLDKDGNLFRADCRKALDTSHAAGHDESTKAEHDRLGTLLHIIDTLRSIDLVAHIRQQTAVRIGADLARTVEFEERWIDLADLEQSIGIPVRNDSWKFAHVTEFLDFKVLDHVTRDWNGDPPVSLNFHGVNTLAHQFDDLVFRVNPSARKNLIFEISVSEFLHDRNHALAATTKLREGGFRVAIDGVALAILDQITGLFPKVQFVKLPWNDAFTHLTPDQKKRFKDLITSNQGEIFVLTRCGREEDVDVGLDLGFSVFQGWGVPPVQSAQPNKVAASLTPASAAPRPKKKAKAE